jgi:periplasmic protein TonB
MSTTVLETKGPNPAFVRAATVACSALLCSSLAYLALSHVPTYEKIFEPAGTTITAAPLPKPVPPPKPIDPPKAKPTPTIQAPDPTISAPTPTVYQPTTARPNPIPGTLPPGPPPIAPTIDSGTGTGTAPIELARPDEIIPPVIAPPIAVPTPPAMPQLVVNPVKMSGANPTFPSRPLEAGISGEVTLSFTVTASGRVEGITILNEAPRRYGFAKAAEDAIATWTFQPQTIDGIPVAYPARYTISFKLED